ncbi:MAG: hypothetical protein O3B01_16390 [Planctomycetota bacterium]|nr:hypothetical protein [Planctomycetota bacterium]MDA1140154.1 hypothetical protein [Planctomycetota bacterium]
MLSKRLPTWICLAVCLAMLGCFINCAFEDFDEHGCQDECLSCACDAAVVTMSGVKPVDGSFTRGLTGLAAISVQTEFSVAVFRPSIPPQFRYRPPERLYQLHAAYLI